MKFYSLFIAVAVCSLSILRSAAQGTTAFTYQGRLSNAGVPVSGIYDFAFFAYETASGPSGVVGGPASHLGVSVTNGLFTVTVDFNINVFTGPRRWLEISVRPQGGDDFIRLNPRQVITPVPYASYAPPSPTVALRNEANRFTAHQAFDSSVRLEGTASFSQSSEGYFAIDAPNVYGGRLTIEPDGRTGIGATFPQQRLSVGGGVNIDHYNQNNGSIANSLSFGSNSGEAIGSKRDPGGNQFGLDFYTGSVNRLNITSGGQVNINSPATLNFGSQTRQMLNLWNGNYGIGVQSAIQYFRTDNGFSWYRGGVHHDSFRNPGGGSETMFLSSLGNLYVLGTFGSLSDRNAKQDFEPVNGLEILEKVAALPLVKWSFKTEPSTRHIGPIAQEFYEAFNVGADDKHIATVDADGVALAAIQGLNQKLEEKNAKIAQLEDRLSKLEQLFITAQGGAK